MTGKVFQGNQELARQIAFRFIVAVVVEVIQHANYNCTPARRRKFASTVLLLATEEESPKLKKVIVVVCDKAPQWSCHRK